MKSSLGVLAAMTLAVAAMGAQAQQWGHGPAARGDHFDGRFNHNHYYAPRGAYIGAMPGRPYPLYGGRYYYSGGVWYAPRGPGFVVVGAPVGVFVPLLPPFYTTVWIGGAPYYYANDTYYTWDAAQNGYQVVQPPADAPAVGGDTQPQAASDDLYVYPQNNQTADQQSNDKYECHKWANSQTGFDPTQTAGGVTPDQLEAKRADYQRAMKACLEGRGYSVR